eukprot:1187032-Prorocentrum_minimum.AAC.6
MAVAGAAGGGCAGGGGRSGGGSGGQGGGQERRPPSAAASSRLRTEERVAHGRAEADRQSGAHPRVHRGGPHCQYHFRGFWGPEHRHAHPYVGVFNTESTTDDESERQLHENEGQYCIGQIGLVSMGYSTEPKGPMMQAGGYCPAGGCASSQRGGERGSKGDQGQDDARSEGAATLWSILFDTSPEL